MAAKVQGAGGAVAGAPGTEGARRATGVAGARAVVVAVQRADPEVPAKAQRRRFTAEYKLRIVEEADGCQEAGAIGALLRREGLPYIVGTSYLDQRIVDAVGLKALKTRSIYRFLQMSQNSRPARGDQTLTLGTAGAEIAYLLDAPLGSCVAIVTRWIYDQNDTLMLAR